MCPFWLKTLAIWKKYDIINRHLCKEKEVGCIAMQPLNGGVMSNIPLAFGFLRQYENVVPVWGARSPDELQQILYFTKNPPRLDEQFYAEADKIREFFN